jgi:hypothetical protein
MVMAVMSMQLHGSLACGFENHIEIYQSQHTADSVIACQTPETDEFFWMVSRLRLPGKFSPGFRRDNYNICAELH